MLWSLLAHGAIHRWKLLRWVTEVGRLVYLHPRMPWEKMVQEAQESGSERVLLWGLALADRLFVLDLPGGLTERFHADATTRRLVRKALSSLSCQQPPQGSGIQGYLAHVNYLALQPTVWSRVHLALQIVFSPNIGEWLLLPLPAKMSFLYYPLRPIRLLVRVIRLLLLKLIRTGSN